MRPGDIVRVRADRLPAYQGEWFVVLYAVHNQLGSPLWVVEGTAKSMNPGQGGKRYRLREDDLEVIAAGPAEEIDKTAVVVVP